MPTIRLNKYLASLGIASRRAIDQLIEQKKVVVNQAPANLGQMVDPAKDEVWLAGKKLGANQPALRYFVLNKPKEVVSTVKDTHGRTTVIDLFKQQFPNLNIRLYPVGRLDYDSEGLIILTNDGQLTNYLTHPTHQVAKVYEVSLTKPLKKLALEHLAEGVELAEGISAPAKVIVLQNKPAQILQITIYQGWKRQIRRMIEAVGSQVFRLKRVAIGKLQLGDLSVGRIREVEGSVFVVK